MATTNQRSQEQKKGEDKGDILRNDDQRSLQRQVLGYLSPKNPIIIGGIFKTALNDLQALYKPIVWDCSAIRTKQRTYTEST